VLSTIEPFRAVGPDLILWLNLAATFVVGFSGGLAAVQARLDIFGVLVLAAVVALAGGITRDLLIGVPPETFRDGRYLAAAGAVGVVCFFAEATVERVHRAVLIFDAIGLSLFCVTGASKALALGLGPAQAVILGTITGIGGGILRDVLLREVPIVLRSDLYAIPALAGATVVTVAHEVGSDHGGFALAGAAVCLAMRLIGLRYGINVPTAPGERRRRDSDP
jgi:uncharacterized membrane protein YeiH